MRYVLTFMLLFQFDIPSARPTNKDVRQPENPLVYDSEMATSL
jgi:hypothetical protein